MNPIQTAGNQTATQTDTQSSISNGTRRASGLSFSRHFTRPGISPYDEITWELRDAIIQDYKGRTIFEQKNVEVPADWSMTATNIVASKYLHGQVGTPERESGVRALITRVAESIRDWGMAAGYFQTPADAATFYAELAHLLLNQKVAFNSPVWFNVGCDRLEPNSDAQNWHWDAAKGEVKYSVTGYSKPQCSACFINSVNDSLDSILTLAKTEGMLFKWGSGAGSNLSSIRGSMETLSGGGTASGPLSFMRGFDAFAGVIKSGGKTRRAAKMVILNIDHPDIEDFIECKVKEEQKAWHLVQAGYDGSGPDSEAYSSIFFQNANNSVRVTDEFMQAVESDGTFTTRTVKGKEPVKEYKARDLMHKIAEATWQCGDPGMQYDTTINRWHTSKNTARINASNPCSEYMFLDDSACNLASFNLLKFMTPGGQFDIAAYRYAIAIVTTAMEIIVDAAGYPTEQIAKNSHDYRPLGLGYANLGALLMAFGLPYDSDAGRDFAATLTSILCGDAYWQSARIAETCAPLGAATPLTQRAEDMFGGSDASHQGGGACPGFYVNREPFLDVIRMHRAEVNNIGKPTITSPRTTAEPFHVPQLDTLIAASAACVGWSAGAWRAARLSQLAGDGAGSDGHDRLHDGLRYDRRGAGPGAGEVQEAGGRRHDQDCELDGTECADQAGLQRGRGERDRQLYRRDRDDRRRAGDQAGAPGGVRLQLQAGEGDAVDSLHGPHQDDGGDAAVPVGRDFEDGEFAAGLLGRGYCRGVRGGVAAGHQGSGDLSRQFEGNAASECKCADGRGQEGDEGGCHQAAAPAAEVAAPAATGITPEAAQAMASAAAVAATAMAQQRAEQQIAALEAQMRSMTEASTQNADALDAQAPPRAVRHRLPAERASVTHKFGLGGHEGTSRWVCIRMARRARFSSAWRRKGRRFPG
jgi:ribonucleoside-diphosphate reductase alpha chain